MALNNHFIISHDFIGWLNQGVWFFVAQVVNCSCYIWWWSEEGGQRLRWFIIRLALSADSAGSSDRAANWKASVLLLFAVLRISSPCGLALLSIELWVTGRSFERGLALTCKCIRCSPLYHTCSCLIGQCQSHGQAQSQCGREKHKGMSTRRPH